MPRITAKGNVLPVEGSIKRITPKNQRLIEVLVAGSVPSIPEAAAAAGLSERAAYKALRQDHIKAELDRQIRERLRTHSLPRAAAVIHKLLTAESEYVQADVAKHILAVHGVKPAGDGARGATAGIQINIIAPAREADSAAQPVTIDVKSDDFQSNQ